MEIKRNIWYHCSTKGRLTKLLTLIADQMPDCELTFTFGGRDDQRISRMVSQLFRKEEGLYIRVEDTGIISHSYDLELCEEFIPRENIGIRAGDKVFGLDKLEEAISYANKFDYKIAMERESLWVVKNEIGYNFIGTHDEVHERIFDLWREDSPFVLEKVEDE